MSGYDTGGAMSKEQKQHQQSQDRNCPRNPIISDSLHQDTLDRVADIIELLEELDLTDGLTPNARAGLYWIHIMLADAVKHVSHGLEKPVSRE